MRGVPATLDRLAPHSAVPGAQVAGGSNASVELSWHVGFVCRRRRVLRIIRAVLHSRRRITTKCGSAMRGSTMTDQKVQSDEDDDLAEKDCVALTLAFVQARSQSPARLPSWTRCRPTA